MGTAVRFCSGNGKIQGRVQAISARKTATEAISPIGRIAFVTAGGDGEALSNGVLATS